MPPRDRTLVPVDAVFESPSDRPRTETRTEARTEAEEEGVELSPSNLSAEALQGLVEEFVSREGTDYGHADRSLESKVRDVLRQLEDGEARIVFDLTTETASIVVTRARSGRGDRRRD
ncbi:MAG: YheU family protein [Myxococcota bacterium]